MTIFANPYLIALWKNLWLLADRGYIADHITDEDRDTISDLSELSAESLRRRILDADRVVLKFRQSTLDSLCGALAERLKQQKLGWSVPHTWELFAKSQSKKKIYIECQRLDEQVIPVINDALRNYITRSARDNAYDIAGIDDGDDNIGHFSFGELNWDVQIAKEEDIYKIYEFAKGRYGDCPINGPDIKLPWWQKNNFTFYVIHDQQGRVCGNLNLLPLKEDCYNRIRSGVIDERGIYAEDLYTPSEKDKVNHIYVEGFNCHPNKLARKFIYLFEAILKNIADVENPNLVIGAIGGTISGETLMEHLGFEIVSNSQDRLDELDYFEVNYQAANRRLRSIKSR